MEDTYNFNMLWFKLASRVVTISSTIFLLEAFLIRSTRKIGSIMRFFLYSYYQVLINYDYFVNFLKLLKCSIHPICIINQRLRYKSTLQELVIS